MGFFSKLKKKLDKSIDSVTSSLNEKLGKAPKEENIELPNQPEIDTGRQQIEDSPPVEKEIRDLPKEVKEEPAELSDVSSEEPGIAPEPVTSDTDTIEEKEDDEPEPIPEKSGAPPADKEELIDVEEEKTEIETRPKDTQDSGEEKGEKKKGFFGKITESFKLNKTKKGLTKTRRNFLNSFASIFGAGKKIDADMLDELEELLITSDIGVETTDYIIDELKLRIKKEGFEEAEDCYRIIKDILYEILEKSPSADNDKLFEIEESKKPYTILVVGVNGVGKTTTIGKLAYNYRDAGKEVIIGAADTFRAAANDQLEIWADRAGVPIVQQGLGADPAAVVYDTLKSAIAKKKDVVIIDTAGRLHNKKNLMDELAKIGRVMNKLSDNKPDEVYLVLDATTGQNAILQAQEFSKVTPITGIVLTKLDGTAKGGVVIPIAHTLQLPVRYIGLGEQINDLMPFDPAYFIEGMFTVTDEDIEVLEN